MLSIEVVGNSALNFYPARDSDASGKPKQVVSLAFSSDVAHVMLQGLSVELFVRISPAQSIQPRRRDRILSHHSADDEGEPKGSDTKKLCSDKHVRMD